MLDALLAAFFLLQLADGWTTHAILKRGGYERNPLIVWLMDEIGTVQALVIYKLLGCLAGWLVYSTGYLWAMGIITVFMAGIIVNNERVLRRLKA